jgi:hypothetical protein
MTIPEIKRLLAALLTRIWQPGHAEHRGGPDCGAAIRPAQPGTTSAHGSPGMLSRLP